MTGLEGLQGNVLAGYATPHASYAFVSVTDGAAARRWLNERVDRVTTHRGWLAAPPATTFNIAFGHAGLLALGVPAARLAHLEAFRAGMAARNAQLGDVGASDPARWEPGARDSDILIVLTAGDLEQLEGARSELHGSLAGGGLILAHEQYAHALPEQRERFGFQDGFSQPAVAGADTGPRVGEGTLTRWGRWRDLALGEFVLGNRDEGGGFAPAPLGALADDATFVVVRKLAQDVAAFRRYTAEAGARLGRDPSWLQAKMIGRWQNGSSLARYPEAPGPPAVEDPRASHFHYRKDPEGLACPLGSHVRRANPRDALGRQGRLTQRHRIIRRGVGYGPGLAEASTVDDGVARGLMFVSYQAAIERQFEFIQRQWLMDGNALRLGDDRDPLLAGEGSPGEMVIQGRPPVFLAGLPSFVTTRGGGYYLLAGIAGLRALAAGAC
jgi:Dyp-type peroxidase family